MALIDWLVFLSVWVVCALFAYQLLKRDWLERFDFTRADRIFFSAISLFGPITLIIGIGIVVIKWVGDRSPNRHEILEYKKYKKEKW